MRCGHNRQLVKTLKISRHVIANLSDCDFNGSSLSSLARRISASRCDNQPLNRSPPFVCLGDFGIRNKARTPVAMVATPSIMKILFDQFGLISGRNRIYHCQPERPALPCSLIQPAEIRDPNAPDKTFPKKKSEVRLVSSICQGLSRLVFTCSCIPSR
jgi:hypothetical protein